ncbi:Eco57I restriction-modification methylase domain-containing protein [Halorientalis marina]|uniref:Eco57I restriction-modification methylase domain-containing protein n=1 Tax=Halorientalis marina TaxID=2931976 RepID=UPI001FF28D0A|nr:N-6 DNA methylase [Halorientalis marina]
MSVQITEDIDVDAIQDLVDSYQSHSAHERKQMKEAAVRQQFINPLLRALGWDTTTDQVKPEQRTLVGDADYALSLNGREQFFIEAKAFSKDLDGTRRISSDKKQSYVEQAIDYAWHQGCDWAVLTNFEELRLYFTHVNKDNLEKGLVFTLSVDDYATEEGLEQLANLSKPAVEDGALERLERVRERDSVTVEILNVLSEARMQLTQDVHDSHPELSLDELRDGVQRILDRVVVMRVAEDRDVIPADTLLHMSESWEQTTINPDVRTLVRDLKNAFRDFDSVYNSELFAEHPCEDYDISNDVLLDIIDSLYDYNFAYIDADVLGSIYEDYLGHAIDDKADDLELVQQPDERREEGIYYTPVPVVEYIVESTVGERVDGIMESVREELEAESPDFEAARREFDEIEKISILDVTCGSGSFLIKAFDLLVDAYEEYQELVRSINGGMNVQEYSSALTIPNDYKRHILRNNIFGVDLDYQATEIATVNLLLKALEKDEKLPAILEDNIKSGNSLLNGSPEEVADVLDVTVEEAEEMGAFEWEEEFAHIFEERGGFDVIVGNPPWGADMSAYEEWLESDYGYELAEGQYDSYELLLELGDDILREGGTLGFIIPDSVLNKNTVPLRRWLIENQQLNRIFKLGEGIFDSVYAGTAIVQYTNRSPAPDNEVEVGLIQKSDRKRMMGSGGEALSSILNDKKNVTKQGRFAEDDEFQIAVWAGEQDYEILDVMEADTVAWNNVIDNGRGDEIGREGNVMKCPYCMEWDTFPRKRAESKGGGYYDKTCSHCGEEYEFEDAISTRKIIQEEPTEDCDTPVYFGEHVNRYRMSNEAYIDADVDGVGLKDDWRYEPPKLLIRQASVGFFTTVDYSEARCLQAVFSFRPKEDRQDPFDNYDLEYFLGFLNSRAMLYYYSKTEGIVEWQSYPRHTQTDIMTLPVPTVDFDDPDEKEAYDEFVELVKEATSDDEQIDEDLDWEIERSALDLYGIPDEKRPRIWNELKKLQRLRIVRELFPDEADE